MSSSLNPMSALGDISVTIIGTDEQTGALMVRDSLSNEFEINANNRMKGIGYPQPGEKWTISKSASQWYLKAQIGTPKVPSITGSRSGIQPILAQILDALALQGMVVDQTSDAPVDVPTPDPLPAPGSPDYLDPTLGVDPIGEGPDDGPIPDDFTGPAPSTNPSPPVAPGKGVYSKTYVPLYAGTYNTLKDLGPRVAYQDLVKLATKTRLQIIGLQEAQGNERDTGFNQLQDLGWSHYRPKIGGYSDENTIIWRTDLFDLLDTGVQQAFTVNVVGMPPRYINWVKVLFKPANRVLYFMSTHTDPHLDVVPYTRDHVGVPNFTEFRPRIEAAITQFANIAAKMQEFGRVAPVILAADLNLSAIGDAKVRYKGFPYAKFGSVGAKSNWSSINHRPHGPTHAGQIDQIWLDRGPDWYVKWVDHWGFSGFHSDHRPVMAQFLMRAKT